MKVDTTRSRHAVSAMPFRPAPRAERTPPIVSRHRWQAIPLAIWLLCAALLAPPVAARQNDTPRVREVTVKKITFVENEPTKAAISFEISGEKFGKTSKPVVKLFDQNTGVPTVADVASHDDNKIVAAARVPVGKDPIKYVFQVTIKDADVIPPDRLSDFMLEVKREQKKDNKKADPFEITFETFKSQQYPNLYSLLITNKNANNTPGFSPNPNLMKVDIVPPGATNISVQPGSSPYQMVVSFLAPEKFEVKGVLVTVFDPNSTLGNNQPVAFSTPFKEKPQKADPNQPTVTNIEVVSLIRRSGYGRLKIEGTGFGEYVRPPIPGEKEMLCCLNRPRNPDISNEMRDRRNRIEAGTQIVEFDPEVCQFGDRQSTCERMRAWRDAIEERVNVILTPRNTNLRVERTQILYIDDRLIDVYFEFTRYQGYSDPFRLQSATVTINKGAVQAAQLNDSNETEIVSAVLSGPKTYSAARNIGPPRDPNLEYSYTVLDAKDASRKFGRGVGENFYVIDLTVVNNGKKKVAVPLGKIQAEVEWAYGDGTKGGEFFDEGPATLAPQTLGSVSADFDAYRKTEGKWARIFNILDGVTTLSATLVPVFGRNIERPNSILSGGFIPGLRKAVGDLSSEQLQRLTSDSWENIEEVAAGTSKTKYVYIPHADQVFGESKRRGESKTTVIRKRIVNILGMEVSGFEVEETEEKLATEQQQQ